MAIETRYKGYRFRSRLEARWAVFLDALGIVWEYEPESFRLANGLVYLPDFWLPTFDYGMYVEVKPTGGDFSKAEKFCFETKNTIWLAEGQPDIRAYTYLIYRDRPLDPGEERVYSVTGIPNGDKAMGENRMFTMPGYENKDGSIPEEYHTQAGISDAVFSARSARFEFGESGALRP